MVLCLTVTAKPEVAAGITAHLQDRVEPALFDGGAMRTSLRFSAQSTGRA